MASALSFCDLVILKWLGSFPVTFQVITKKIGVSVPTWGDMSASLGRGLKLC